MRSEKGERKLYGKLGLQNVTTEITVQAYRNSNYLSLSRNYDISNITSVNLEVPTQ